jgi:hypothetical protein|tara:strand:- start:443 stop:730 length:288 start_codon:yes stop_codon:yes gene_type:complete
MKELEFKGTSGEWVVNVNNPKSMLTNMGGYIPNSIQVVACSKDELLANAKLIAAAPDLLDACQFWIENQESDDPSGGLNEAFFHNFNNAINKALK